MNQRETPDVTQDITQLCERYNVVALYVFGSQATVIWERITSDKTAPLMAGHDVDVGVKCRSDHRLTIKNKVELAQALEALFAVPRIDLVCLDEADPFLAANIIRGERLYTADTYTADEYELYVLRRAGDLAPFERARIKLILEGQS
jgi:predicted nucleotidyltransferase